MSEQPSSRRRCGKAGADIGACRRWPCAKVNRIARRVLAIARRANEARAVRCIPVAFTGTDLTTKNELLVRHCPKAGYSADLAGKTRYRIGCGNQPNKISPRFAPQQTPPVQRESGRGRDQVARANLSIGQMAKHPAIWCGAKILIDAQFFGVCQRRYQKMHYQRH